MKRFSIIPASIISAWLFAAALLFAFGCERRPLGGGYSGETVLIPVKVDWSRSNIDVSEDDPTGGGEVHRVSLRFYPLDGSDVFERYLEGNIFEGTVRIPPGSYRVIAMNESIEDVNYWGNVITFSDADDFDNFSATADPMTDEDRLSDFPYYRPPEGEKVIVEPLALASWSLDRLEVTLDPTPRADAGVAHNSLTDIVMRQLTYTVDFTVRVRNLSSAIIMPTALRGFADKVYMASGRTEQSSATQLFIPNIRVWYPNAVDGMLQRKLLSLGRLPREEAGSYTASMDVLLASGELWTHDNLLTFDVTDQVTGGSGPDIVITLPPGSNGGMIELPQVEGGIAVDPWEDDEITLN